MITFAKKYIIPGKSPLFYIFAFVLVIIFLVIGHFAQIEYRSLHLSFYLHSEKNVLFEVYYDVGKGLSENDRQSKLIDTSGEATVVNFCIPVYHRVKLLRFDPAKEPVRMSISKVEYSYDPGEVRVIPLEQIIPIHHIQSHEIVDNQLFFEAVGDDPGFIINDDLSYTEGSTSAKLAYYFTYLIAGICSAFLFRFVYLFFFKAL